MRYLFSLIAVFAFTSAYAAPTQVTLKDGKGTNVGTATITPLAKGVKIDLELHGVTPGEHAFHIHENGVCTGPKFDSAGGHFNPEHHEHGFDMVKGFHDGDMPNVVVGSDGKAKVEIVNTEVTLSEGPNSLLKKGGTAFVLHEKADDYKSQPAGNAGSRLACGAIL
jgi:Cu-Zn family superoxide dismutase